MWKIVAYADFTRIINLGSIAVSLRPNIFQLLLQRTTNVHKQNFLYLLLSSQANLKGSFGNPSLAIRKHAMYFTANLGLIILLTITSSMQLVSRELVVPCSSYKTIKSTRITSCLKSILIVSIIPIMLLLASTLTGLTLLREFPTVAYATQVEIQNSNEIRWYDKALAINQNNVPALVQRGTDLINQGKY